MDFTKCVTLMGALLLLGVFLPSEACRCLTIDHLQKPFCDSDSAIKVKFLQASKQGLKSGSNTNVTGYDSETLQVLKGNATLLNSTFIKRFMVGTSCEYSHPADGFNVPFLVMGSFTNGSVGVGGCSLPTRWSNLTASQVTGLQGAYKPGCGKCQIIREGMNPCDPQPCEPPKNQCVLVNATQTKNQACLPTKYGACAWKDI